MGLPAEETWTPRSRSHPVCTLRRKGSPKRERCCPAPSSSLFLPPVLSALPRGCKNPSRYQAWGFPAATSAHFLWFSVSLDTQLWGTYRNESRARGWPHRPWGETQICTMRGASGDRSAASGVPWKSWTRQALDGAGVSVDA